MFEELYNRIKANCVVDPVTGCHLWQGGTDGKDDPYGRISHRGITIATHIGVFKHKKGRIPKGKDVDHKCVRRLCCNEDHLQAVTKKKNAKLREKRKKYRDDVFRCIAAR